MSFGDPIHKAAIASLAAMASRECRPRFSRPLRLQRIGKPLLTLGCRCELTNSWRIEAKIVELESSLRLGLLGAFQRGFAFLSRLECDPARLLNLLFLPPGSGFH